MGSASVPALWVVVAALLASVVVPAQEPQRQDLVFGTTSRLVSVDARVFDRSGKAITDLVAADFAVTDDNIPQKLVLFTVRSLADTPGTPSSTVVTAIGQAGATRQDHRTFLLVLGRGRFVGPERAVEAAVDFIRRRTLRTDRVAVVAYNRATPFSLDRVRLVETIERFQRSHLKIEALLRSRSSGLAGLYGRAEIPATVQSMIDEIFAHWYGDVTSLRSGVAPGVQATLSDQRRTSEDLQRAAILADRIGGPPDPLATATADRVGMSFDEYVALGVETIADLGNLYKGIDYLRHLDGEKQVVFITPLGLYLTRTETEDTLVGLASDARVAINIIYTGGPVGARPPTGRESTAVPTSALLFHQTFKVQGLRSIAEGTGGLFAGFVPGATAFRRLDESTRFHYVLGYVPTNLSMDGSYRQIKVRVMRPGVRVEHRTGYFARVMPRVIDPRAFLVDSRIAEAAAANDDIAGVLKLEVHGELSAAPVELRVGLRVLPTSMVVFERAGDRFRATAHVAVYCGDSEGRLVGQLRQQLDLDYSGERYQDYLREGLTHAMTVPLKSEARHVRAIVYFYEADAVGTASVKLR